MILPESFGHMPLPWGYAIFDTVTGVPMVCGAVFGGLLYRTSFGLPFKVAIVIVGGLLLLTIIRGPRLKGKSSGRRAETACERRTRKRVVCGIYPDLTAERPSLAHGTHDADFLPLQRRSLAPWPSA